MKELIAHIRRELLRLRDLKDEYLRRLECLPEGKLKVDEKNGKKYYYHLLGGNIDTQFIDYLMETYFR